MKMKLVLYALAATLLAPNAFAQNYPNRTINVIVPFAAGGNTDVVGRIVAEHMSRVLGQPMVIENVPGAGGTTGSARAAKADPNLTPPEAAYLAELSYVCKYLAGQVVITKI